MDAASKPLNITTERFEAEVIHGELPAIIDFWAPWCGPCRAIAPELDALAASHAGQLRIVKVNVDEEPAIAEAFQVRGIPTVVGMKGDQVVDVQVGFRGRAALQALAGRLVAMGSPGLATGTAP